MSTNAIRQNLLDIPDVRRHAQELSRLVAEQQALLADLARLRRDTICGVAGRRSHPCTDRRGARCLPRERVARLEPSSTTSLTTPTSSLTGQSPTDP